jgi:hypothetical protein
MIGGDWASAWAFHRCGFLLLLDFPMKFPKMNVRFLPVTLFLGMVAYLCAFGTVPVVAQVKDRQGSAANRSVAKGVQAQTVKNQTAPNQTAQNKSGNAAAEDPNAIVTSLGVSLRKVDSKGFKETQGPEAEDKLLMRYKFAPGTVLRSEVLHVSKNGTRINSVLQEASSRTITEKSWHVLETNDSVTTFEYRVDQIELAQQFGESEEIRYSTKEATEKPPVQFASAVDTAGKVISTIQIDARGMVVARSDSKDPPHMGMGDITMPLPSEPVGMGATWEVPREMRIDRKDGTSRLIKFRELFKLEKISAGVATVSVRSEPLSAIADPAEEAQVMQQLSNGTIQFDVDAGRMISKELAWDHQVVAFSGPGSVLEYSARLEDRVVSAKVEPSAASKLEPKTASKPSAKSDATR